MVANRWTNPRRRPFPTSKRSAASGTSTESSTGIGSPPIIDFHRRLKTKNKVRLRHTNSGFRDLVRKIRQPSAQQHDKQAAQSG